MTSDTGSHIQYWAHYQLAQNYYQEHKLLLHDQFNAIDWKSVHNTLHSLPRLFQLWALKHVLGIAGTMNFLSHQDGRSPLCPSCNECTETCKHIAQCPETGRATTFLQSTTEVEKWMDCNGTHPDVKLLLLQYLRRCGSITCAECSDDLNLPPIVREYAISQDVIGWDNFVHQAPCTPEYTLPHNWRVISRYVVDCRFDNPTATGDAHAVDIQMHASPGLYHRCPNIGAQGQPSQRTRAPAGSRAGGAGRGGSIPP
jgi:hypothetical protein